jgi:glucose/arabinose dehydrogenase
VGQVGIRPEIWHKGFRNPWRFSIDEATGDMWIGDVGNNEIEEINVVPASQGGLNFGWYFFEGTNQRYDGAPPGTISPVFEYPHSVGPAVIAGHVYRGSAIPGLAGAFVFADIGGIFWALGTDDAVELPLTVDGAVTAIEEGPDGELYVLTLQGGAYRLVAG